MSDNPTTSTAPTTVPPPAPPAIPTPGVTVRFQQGGGEIKEISVPSWTDGLRVMGKVMRRLTPPARLERDPAARDLIAAYERADARFVFPWTVYACGTFAVQVIDRAALAAHDAKRGGRQ